MNHKISIIIATKKFSNNLLKTIGSINKQSFLPKEIILVSNEKIYSSFNLKKKINLKKYTSKINNQVIQRNLAFRNVSKKINLVLQLDDRIILKRNCLYELIQFWSKNDALAFGVGLNQINFMHDNGLFNRFISRFLKLKGKVLNNGIVMDYANIKDDLEVMWLKGGMSSWKIDKNRKIFDRKYPTYDWSVFEDIEFCLSKKKSQKLFVASKAKAEIIERKKKINIKNLFFRGTMHSFVQKKIVKKYFKSMVSFFFTMPLLILFSLIISILTINISKFIYNLGRIRGFFIIHFN